jgi:sterol desaturase/sphingolipid hydroxylase (fatty acid hydroxylase superfamily)
MHFHIWAWLQEKLEQGFGLSSPFCPWYLVSATLGAGFWLMHTQGWTFVETLRYTRRLVWTHRHAIRVDGFWALVQLLFLRVPVALFHVALFQWAYQGMLDLGADRIHGIEAPEALEALVATLVTMLAIDAAAYAVHRALHGLPSLWWIHRLHHEARFLTPLSTLRQHPLEPFLLNGTRGLIAGISLGLVHLILPNETPVWSYAGMGFGFFLYMFTVNLHHAPFPIRYPNFLCSILISPHMHHLHHSRAPEHFGKNFGVVFSFWDRIFGSYWDQTVGLDELEFGA